LIGRKVPSPDQVNRIHEALDEGTRELEEILDALRLGKGSEAKEAVFRATRALGDCKEALRGVGEVARIPSGAGDGGARVSSTWWEFQGKSIDRFSEQQERSWIAIVEFWKHLVVVEATVLGLTVGLFAADSRGTSIVLILAWVALLLGIFSGCVLIRAGIEAKQSRTFQTFRSAYDISEIKARVDAGELSVETDEYQQLMVAAIMQSTPEWEFKKTYTQKAIDDAREWANRLPSAMFVKQKSSRIYKLLEKHLVAVEIAFYGASVIAFGFMVCAVLK
jgi:hypothetical protein